MNSRNFLTKPFRDASRKRVEEVGSDLEEGFEEMTNRMPSPSLFVY